MIKLSICFPKSCCWIQSRERQAKTICVSGMYLYQMGYTMFSANKVDNLGKASCEPGSFNYVLLDDRVGMFVKFI